MKCPLGSLICINICVHRRSIPHEVLSKPAIINTTAMDMPITALSDGAVSFATLLS